MRGFGRYAVLNQEHARAAAQSAATKERKDAGREVTDRRLESKDRDQLVRKVERVEASPPLVDKFNLRPSRPMVADAWSLILPTGPAPGESESGYIVRRGTHYQQVREERRSAVRQANTIARTEGADFDPQRRNKLIKEILEKRAAVREERQAQAAKDKDAAKGVEVNDD